MLFAGVIALWGVIHIKAGERLGGEGKVVRAAAILHPPKLPLSTCCHKHAAGTHVVVSQPAFIIQEAEPFLWVWGRGLPSDWTGTNV